MKKLSKETSIERIMQEISKREVGQEIFDILSATYSPKKAKTPTKSSEPKDYGTPVFISDKKFVRYQNADGG